MKCPHCRNGFHDEPHYIKIGEDIDGSWHLVLRVCPECHRLILHLDNTDPQYTKVYSSTLVRPKGSSRPPCPTEVPEKFAADYKEACLVLPDSPKASAALSRRCLQNIFREVAKVKPRNLADEIQQVIDSGNLPHYLAENVDAIRNIGNFAAHPNKSQRTGEIIPVEPGEAEWNLDVLEELFEFYFVRPAAMKKKRDALDAKLKEVGKKPMKKPAK